MMKKPNCPIIAIEEHYWDPELTRHYTGIEAPRGADVDKKLYDLGSLRLQEMDAAGIDMQVISHGAPSAQKLPAEGAAALLDTPPPASAQAILSEVALTLDAISRFGGEATPAVIGQAPIWPSPPAIDTQQAAGGLFAAGNGAAAAAAAVAADSSV